MVYQQATHRFKENSGRVYNNDEGRATFGCLNSGQWNWRRTRKEKHSTENSKKCNRKWDKTVSTIPREFYISVTGHFASVHLLFPPGYLFDVPAFGK